MTTSYGLFFLGCCVFGHLFIRARLPDADPYLFPLTAVLAAFGLVMIYRIDEELAREQAQWFVVGLLFFCATIVFLRDYRVLERYRYTIAAAGLALLFMPRMPGIGAQVNGAFLAVKVGPIQFQPAEFAKIAIVVFLASYLNDTREVLVKGRIPRLSLKHFGPLLLVWGAAMLMLVFIRDLGSSLMFFGGFLALLYIATARLSLVAAGFAMFFAGATFFANSVSHVQERVDIWLDPFAPDVVDKEGYQIAQGLFAQADGGLFGKGFGEALLELPNGGTILPGAAHRPHLRGDHQRARAVRRRGRHPRLPAVRAARLQDGDDRQRRLLEAVGRRPDRRLRAAGVRDRRRGDEGYPAHGRDVALRLLRR